MLFIVKPGVECERARGTHPEWWGVVVRIMNILMTFYLCLPNLCLENVYIPTFRPLLTPFAAAYDKWSEFGYHC